MSSLAESTLQSAQKAGKSQRTENKLAKKSPQHGKEEVVNYCKDHTKRYNPEMIIENNLNSLFLVWWYP